MRAVSILLLYAAAIAFVWIGTLTAPQSGWPVDDRQLQGCAALILGMILKTAGHWTLLGVGRRTAA